MIIEYFNVTEYRRWQMEYFHFQKAMNEKHLATTWNKNAIESFICMSRFIYSAQLRGSIHFIRYIGRWYHRWSRCTCRHEHTHLDIRNKNDKISQKSVKLFKNGEHRLKIGNDQNGFKNSRALMNCTWVAFATCNGPVTNTSQNVDMTK